MNAFNFGSIVGMFLAAGGVAYIWLGILWAIRIYRRWPRFSYWSAATIPMLLGLMTAISTGEFLMTMMACGAASAFVIWRGLPAFGKDKTAPPPPNTPTQ